MPGGTSAVIVKKKVFCREVRGGLPSRHTLPSASVGLSPNGRRRPSIATYYMCTE